MTASGIEPEHTGYRINLINNKSEQFQIILCESDCEFLPIERKKKKKKKMEIKNKNVCAEIFI